MRRRHGNFWAFRAARLTALAHRRQPHVKWLTIAALSVAWLTFGLLGWLTSNTPPGDALYKTLGALTVQGTYENADAQGNVYQQIARFAGVFVPLVGILFAFSGQLGRALAGVYMTGASRHIVIAGSTPAALSLARSCVASGDAVALIASDLAPETTWSLRQAGVILYEGDGGDRAVLRAARADHAAHFVALLGDDAANLKAEAALRNIVSSVARRKPMGAHVGISSPLLLMEAREMRMMLQRERDAKSKAAKKALPIDPIDPRPFSLNEIAARALITREASVILGVAEANAQPRPHLVFFGFEPAAEAVAVRVLMSLWSSHLGEPRITVVTPDPETTNARFTARYPHALTHDVWQADIAFIAFDWRERAMDAEFLTFIAEERGAVSAVVIDTGVDAETIQLGFSVMRTANIAGSWPAPIYLKEAAQSEFSAQFASGARGPEAQGAYLQAFGAVETVASRALIIDGLLDEGAAIAHKVYQEGIASRDDVDTRQLEAVGRSWDDVPETYRAANRAVADAAMVKLWDFGWRAVSGKERGVNAPPLDGQMMLRMGEIEHKRWCAERLLSGWRPGSRRDNAMMVHDNLVPWRDLSMEVRERDVDQVKAAITVARIMHPRGFAPDPRKL